MDEQRKKTSTMSARLVLLLVVVAALGVAFAVRQSSPPTPNDEAPWEDEGDDVDEDSLREITQLDLPGEEPEEPPEFDIQVELDTSTIKSRMVLYIAEAHGYYVETVSIRFWWKGDDPNLEREDSIFSFVYRMNNYIKANETFKDCFELSAPEIARVGGDPGTVENWGWTLESYGRARATNPESFPPVSPAGRHCS
ncbi:MAG: hypothetical protein ACE5HE_03590 [Phycisphaerae bacterium]